MKYIMLDCGPVIFTEGYSHAEMAAGRKVSSAGFVIITNGRFYAYGESFSLGIKSGRMDSELINKEFGLEE